MNVQIAHLRYFDGLTDQRARSLALKIDSLGFILNDLFSCDLLFFQLFPHKKEAVGFGATTAGTGVTPVSKSSIAKLPWLWIDFFIFQPQEAPGLLADYRTRVRLIEEPGYPRVHWRTGLSCPQEPGFTMRVGAFLFILLL